MIRDAHGIIVQPNHDYDFEKPYSEQPDKVDEGDSAFSTGLSSFGGSEQDFKLMPLFIKDGKVVRHPFAKNNTGDAPHDDPAATSADQVKAFFAGLYGRNRLLHLSTHVEVWDACLKHGQSWRVNKDFLSPSDKLFFYKVGGFIPPPWLSIAGRAWLCGTTVVNCFINPKHEMTQATAMQTTYGRRWLYVLYKCHPDLFDNLDNYFGGWRKRQPIADGMKSVVKKVLNLPDKV